MQSGTARDYVTRVLDDPSQIEASAWDDLLSRQDEPTPFMRHAFLAALHRHGCAVAATGWQPQFITLWQGDALQAACVLYLKAHSYGEYVFDWAWAEAYARHGLAYYPKALSAVPFTPVPGTRLLARDADARQALVQALQGHAQQAGLSSAHVLFPDDRDRQALAEAGWMIRQGVQFHWNRDPQSPAGDFRAFLAGLQRDKRKKIQQEQRRVREAGIRFTVHQGAEITDALWDHFFDCYALTYRLHRSTPYLNRNFFAEVGRTMAQHWLMFVAWRGDRPVASSLIALDPHRRVAYGRYWGSLEAVDCLHFDACYYQPLAWCIEQGYVRFEGGAQGEHKMARGLLPVVTHSAHWLADARFARAVEDFLEREGAHVGAYVDELRDRNPFKSPT